MAKATEATEQQTTETPVDYDRLIAECQNHIAKALADEVIELETAKQDFLNNKADIRKQYARLRNDEKDAIAQYTREKREAAKPKK